MDYNLSTGHSHPCGYAVLWNKKKIFSNKLINLHILSVEKIVWLPFKKELNTPHANYNFLILTSFQPNLVDFC